MSTINIASEQVIALRDATTHLPRGPSGKKPHLATLYRWATRGVSGTRLETIRVGGARYTSVEALQRFVDRLSDPPARSTPQASRRRSRETKRTERELDELGIK